MIKVTFLVGNGFDIRVGLKTGYPEFYKYYIEKCENDLLAREINKNYEYWSDLEFGLGEYTKKVTEEREEAFWSSETNLESELLSYLESEMDKVSMEKAETKRRIASEMQKSLEQFHTELPRVHQNRISNIYNGMDEIVYSFISFNYTNVLDRCLRTVDEYMPTDFSLDIHNEQKQGLFKIGEIIHVHGTIWEETVLGVNDESQIGNERFRKNELYRQCFIKEETNRRYGNLNTERTAHIIDDSNIICVFGMSIGKTDRMWWKHICQWLWDDEERVLVIYTWTNENLKKYSNRKIRFNLEDIVRKKFKENADVFDDDWNHIKERICVKVNSNIFGFKVV